jgi:hypothetical protein
MSYGFQLLNNAGQVLANDTDYNYALVASGTCNVTSTSASTQVSFSNSTGEQPLIFIRNASTKYLAKQSVGATYFSVYMFELNVNGYRSVTTGSFEYRVYLPMKALPTTVPSGDEYGIHIFDASGQKTFDSTKSYPLITGVANLALPGDTSEASVTLPAGTVSNPWIDISNLPTYYVGLGYILSTYILTYRGMRVANGKLETAACQLFIGSGPGVNIYWGAAATKPFLIMNAASNDPLAATIGEYYMVQNQTTCTYNPASTSFCSTQYRYIVNYTGGNANPVTYSWSIAAPANGFYFDSGYGTSGNIVIVKHDGTGSVSPYTATLQCQVQQSGSTTQIPTLALSHTHTATATPLTVSATVSNQTTSCTSTVACSTQETWTATTSGGNGNPITYTWSFQSNPGGFSLSSTTGASTTVSLTATGATTGTSFQAELLCTASQSGMADATYLVYIGHTHTTTSSVTITNPLGCQSTSYGDSALSYVATTLYINPNGTWEIVGSSSGQLATGAWANSTSVGSQYSVWFTKTAGSGTATSTTWQSLSSSRYVTVSANALTNNDFKSGTYTIQIRNESTQSVVSTTTAVNMTASAQYDDGGMVQ